MTEVEKLDAEIVRLAPDVADILSRSPNDIPRFPEIADFLRTVEAKRAAMQPKPLSAEEAMNILQRSGDMEVPLRECRKRDLAVIDKALADAHYVETAPCRDIVRRILGSALDGRSA